MYWPVVCKMFNNNFCKSVVLVGAAAHFVSRLCFTLQIVVSYMGSFKARKKSLGRIKALGVSFHMERFICVWVYDSGLFLYYTGSSVWIMSATISQSKQNLHSSLCRNMCEPVFTLYAVKMRETKRLKIEEKIE